MVVHDAGMINNSLQSLKTSGVNVTSALVLCSQIKAPSLGLYKGSDFGRADK